jgi:hypothetical protein
MRRRVIGATLTILGVLIVLFAPARQVGGCAASGAGCTDFGSDSWWHWIHWPSGWDTLLLPMLAIGAALMVAGIVLIVRARRFS